MNNNSPIIWYCDKCKQQGTQKTCTICSRWCRPTQGTTSPTPNQSTTRSPRSLALHHKQQQRRQNVLQQSRTSSTTQVDVQETKTRDTQSTLPLTLEDTIITFDVGQGDCTLVINNGKTLLIDCGRHCSGSATSRKLASLGIKKIDYAILTHADSDHYGGFTHKDMRSLLKDTIFYCTKPNRIKFSNKLSNAGLVKTLQFVPTDEAGQLLLNGMSVFYYLTKITDTIDLNNTSPLLSIHIGLYAHIVCGDLTLTAEAMTEVITHLEQCNVQGICLMLPHHGSFYSLYEEVLINLNNKFKNIFCTLSCSSFEYGHPHQEVINWVTQQNIKIYMTNLWGVRPDDQACHYQRVASTTSQYGDIIITPYIENIAQTQIRLPSKGNNPFIGLPYDSKQSDINFLQAYSSNNTRAHTRTATPQFAPILNRARSSKIKLEHENSYKDFIDKFKTQLNAQENSTQLDSILATRKRILTSTTVKSCLLTQPKRIKKPSGGNILDDLVASASAYFDALYNEFSQRASSSTPTSRRPQRKCQSEQKSKFTGIETLEIKELFTHYKKQLTASMIWVSNEFYAQCGAEQTELLRLIFDGILLDICALANEAELNSKLRTSSNVRQWKKMKEGVLQSQTAKIQQESESNIVSKAHSFFLRASTEQSSHQRTSKPNDKKANSQNAFLDTAQTIQPTLILLTDPSDLEEHIYKNYDQSCANLEIIERRNDGYAFVSWTEQSEPVTGFVRISEYRLWHNNGNMY